MSSIIELLREYFNDIPDSTLARVAEICEIRVFESNEIIYREHEESKHLCIVNSGQVDVQYLMPNGRRETVDTCVKGDFLLWSALVPPNFTNSIGICRAKAEVLALDGPKLRELCESDPKFGYQLMKHIAGVIRRRLQAARAEIVDLRD